MIFSMPPGTPPQKVLSAVRTLAREEFALKHRYAMVLHTDEPHPHVHVVVKALGEDGRRLNIRKETLRNWRREFARHLREEGVAANATDRASQGKFPWSQDRWDFPGSPSRRIHPLRTVGLSRSRGNSPKDHSVPSPGRRRSWGPGARCFAGGRRLRAPRMRSASLNWPRRCADSRGKCRHRLPISNR